RAGRCLRLLRQLLLRRPRPRRSGSRHHLRGDAVPQRLHAGQPPRHAVPPREEPERGLDDPRQRPRRRDPGSCGMKGRARPALLALLAVITCGGGAAAQAVPGWTVQVVALRDFREAQAAVTELRVLEFDAYSEFAMSDGQEDVRVRAACFAGREGAEALAAVMRGRITAEAEAVELSPRAPVSGCVEEEVGFLNSYDWELMSQPSSVPSFRVVLSGIVARLVHDGRRWRVLQVDGEAQAVGADVASG